MECPNCHHRTASGALVQCSECGQTFERAIIEELAHLDYLENWLAKRRGQEADAKAWRDEIAQRRTRLQADAFPAGPAKSPEGEPAALLPTEPVIPTPQPVNSSPAIPEQKRPAAAAPQPPRARKSFWAEAVGFVVSGALLRTLLYLGAFMIVVSATVLVILFWDSFAPALQIVFIFSVPTGFYLAGWLIRTRLKLAQAGVVMTGIGALLFGVDFAAVYQFSHLRIGVDPWWLIASISCTALYMFTAWRIRAEFFDYLSLVAVTSTVLALTRVLDAPAAWSIVSVIGLSVAMAWVSPRLPAAGRAMQLMVPVSLLALLYVSPSTFTPQSAGFSCAGLAYIVLAWRSRSARPLYAGLLCIAAAAWFGMDLFGSRARPWFTTVGAVISTAYVFVGWRFFSDDTGVERGAFRLALQRVGIGLSLLLAFWATLELPGARRESALALTLISTSLWAWGFILDRPVLRVAGSALFLLPFWAWLTLTTLSIDLYPLAFVLLAGMAYIPTGLILERRWRARAMPLFWIGYAVTFCAAAAYTLTSLFQTGDGKWIQQLTLPAAIALWAFGARHFKQSFLMWAVAFAAPLAYADWLDFFHVIPSNAAICWAVLALAYLLVERLLARTPAPFSGLAFRLPFGLGVPVLGILALALSEWEMVMPAGMFAQILLVAIAILAAILYRSRWPGFVASLLVLLPYLHAWDDYVHPSQQQYVYIWMGLAAFLLLCGFLLDRLPAGGPLYGQGPYAIGYVFSAAALGLSVPHAEERLVMEGIIVAVCLLSFLVAHAGWHRSLEDLAGLFIPAGSPDRRAAGVLFLCVIVVALPVWLADGLAYWRSAIGWISLAEAALALALCIAGTLIKRAHPVYRWPFYLSAHLLNLLALTLAYDASVGHALRAGILVAGSLLYFYSAWQFGQAPWLYPGLFLVVMAYAESVPLLQFAWLRDGFKWLPPTLLYIGIGRFVFQRAGSEIKRGALFRSWALPFYIVAYPLSILLIVDSYGDPTSLTLACGMATALYLGSALLFRHPAWLYPTLAAAHLTVLAYFSIHPSASPARAITLPFLALTWLEALAGLLIARRYPITRLEPDGRRVFTLFGRTIDFGAFPSLGYLTVPSWAQPIFIVAALDILAWETLALTGFDTGVIVSIGYGLLLGLLATLWMDALLAHVALLLVLVAGGWQLRSLGVASTAVFVWYAGIALGLYLLAILVDRVGRGRARPALWAASSARTAVALSILCLLIAVPVMWIESLRAAYIFALTGALYLTLSVRGRSYPPGYLGVALILAAWSLMLFVNKVNQPQAYAVPAGLYLAAMGFLERRRRPGRFSLLVESLGLAILLVTSFVQSLDGRPGFPYFVLLLVEGLLVIWWGAARRLRVPFLIGIAASVINLVAQVIVVVQIFDINRWFVIFGVGLLLMGLGLFVERRRETLMAQAQGWRTALERWE